MHRIEMVMSDGRVVILHGATIARQGDCFEVTYERAEVRNEVKVTVAEAELSVENIRMVVEALNG